MVIDEQADQSYRTGLDGGFFTGLTQCGGNRVLVGVARTADDAPGTAFMSPGGTMLQDGLVAIDDQQSRRAVQAPVPMARSAGGPAIT